MNALLQLQEDVTAALLANPATAFVPYSIYRKLVVQSAADEAAAAWKVRQPADANGNPAQVGLACLVLMPSLQVITPNVPGPQYNVSIVLRTFHDPVINNTGYSCEEIAMANLTWLDGQQFEPITCLYGEEHGDAVAPNNDYPGLLVYDSKLVGPLPQPLQVRTKTPGISDDGAGNVTLSNNDTGGQIYYTLDDTCPLPPANLSEQAGFTGQIYAAPFHVPAGIAVRACCWNPPLLPSSMIQGRITY